MLLLALSHGIFQPEDLVVPQRVFDRVSSESWFTSAPDQREEFARYVLRMYSRGLVLQERLEELCRVAARNRFATVKLHHDIKGRHFLVVEDEYMIAREAAQRLTELGARVVGPVGNVSDAFEIVESPHVRVDAALLDIVLDGQTVYPVAAFLKMKHIPFAFVSGRDDRQIPAFYRSTPKFSKPVDWGLIAAHLTDRPTTIASNAVDSSAGCCLNSQPVCWRSQ
jgi:CheY-like chemotaxis protein